MNRFRSYAGVATALTILTQSICAQSPAAKTKAPPANSASQEKSAARAEVDRLARERRAQARSLLLALASDARRFREQSLRARTLARIADALWSVDAEQGRALFRKAWEAAETGDRESHGLLNNGQWPPNLRGETLRLAARRDRLLVEEFLEQLQTDREENKAERPQSDPWRLAEASEQRLGLARGLLRAGNIDQALHFADPVLTNVTMSTVDFLSELRDKDPGAADRRYAQILTTTRTNLTADANSIALLTSYIFTPHLYVIPSGYTMPPAYFPPAEVGTPLRLAFFETAAAVLLRPQSTETVSGGSEIAARYMVVKRLLPLFEQSAPPDITDAMRSYFQALTAQISNEQSGPENDWWQKGLLPEQTLADQEQPLLDQIDRARTTNERDGLYLKLALLALSKDELQAREYAGKIEPSEYRQRVQAWVDACLAVNAVKKKNVEKALLLARSGALTHLQRLWIFTETAKLLAKTDRNRAVSLLDDAAAEADRVEGVDQDRPRGFLGVANAARLLEPSRAWDATFDAIKAANSTTGFTGEDGVLNLGRGPQVSVGDRTYAAPDFDVEGIFTILATDDYDRAVQLARGFQGEAPRANATIAIARSVLSEKNPEALSPQRSKRN